MDYRMVSALILCCLYPHLINMSIWNTTINIITVRSIVKFQPQRTHQFQHWLHLLLHQQMAKDVNYLVQYMRISSIKFYLNSINSCKECKLFNEVTDQNIISQNMEFYHNLIFLERQIHERSCINNGYNYYFSHTRNNNTA